MMKTEKELYLKDSEVLANPLDQEVILELLLKQMYLNLNPPIGHPEILIEITIEKKNLPQVQVL